MKFGLIYPTLQQSYLRDCPSLDEALEQAVLQRGHVDFGRLSRNASIVVYEFGLFAASGMAYFAINRAMYAGNAVIFATDDGGNTTDLPDLPPVLWLPTRMEAEKAILLGTVIRPQMAVNGVVSWEWRP